MKLRNEAVYIDRTTSQNFRPHHLNWGMSIRRRKDILAGKKDKGIDYYHRNFEFLQVLKLAIPLFFITPLYALILIGLAINNWVFSINIIKDKEIYYRKIEQGGKKAAEAVAATEKHKTSLSSNEETTSGYPHPNTDRSRLE